MIGDAAWIIGDLASDLLIFATPYGTTSKTEKVIGYTILGVAVAALAYAAYDHFHKKHQEDLQKERAGHSPDIAR